MCSLYLFSGMSNQTTFRLTLKVVLWYYIFICTRNRYSKYLILFYNICSIFSAFFILNEASPGVSRYLLLILAANMAVYMTFYACMKYYYVVVEERYFFKNSVGPNHLLRITIASVCKLSQYCLMSLKLMQNQMSWPILVCTYLSLFSTTSNSLTRLHLWITLWCTTSTVSF